MTCTTYLRTVAVKQYSLMTVASFSRILFPIIKKVWEWFKEEHSNDFEVLTYLPNSPDLSSIMGQGRFGSIRTNRILGRKVVCSDQYMYPHGGLQFYQTECTSVPCTGDAGFLPVLQSRSDSQHASARLNGGLHASFFFFLLLVSFHSLCFHCVLLSSCCCRHSVFLPILSPISSPHI